MNTRMELQYPWLADRSAWHEVITQAQIRSRQTGAGHGCWPLGNGLIFAIRREEPFTRLSHILGPGYSREPTFSDWGSQSLYLRRDGELLLWDRQEAFRVRRTPILGVDATAGDLRLLVVDVAPPGWPVILRSVALQNIGKVAVNGLTLDVIHEGAPGGSLATRGNGWEITHANRRLRVIALGHVPEIGDAWLRIPLPELVPGEDEILHIAIIAGHGIQENDLLVEKLSRNPDRVPETTYHWWQGYLRNTLAVSSDDVGLGDLITDATVTIATQQSTTGVLCPLIERSIVHIVEESAPLRWLLTIGKWDAALQVLDAQYRETCRSQRFAAWLPAELPQSAEELSEPNWATLTPPPAWTAATIIHAYRECWRQTGDRKLLATRFRYLRWLAEGQTVSPDGLVAFGGDEPFYTAFQRLLPLEQQEYLLPDPGPYARMRPYPWGAAPAMALCHALELLAEIANAVEDEETAPWALARAQAIREATERSYWLPEEGYYAAARSRVDGMVYRIPHLPTALAPITTGYAHADEAQARQGLDNTLRYLLNEHGLPLIIPGVTAYSGEMLGDLLGAMAAIGDSRLDAVYLAVLGSASPAGEFRHWYDPGQVAMPHNGAARPSDQAAVVQGILAYLLGRKEQNDQVTLTPHLPPTSKRLHVENLAVRSSQLAAVVTRTDDTLRIDIGNAGPADVQIGMGDLPPVVLQAEERQQWERPVHDQARILAAPRAYQIPVPEFPPASMLILTVDADSFTDWRREYSAILVDASMPVPPEALARALCEDRQRRYDVVYLDVPETGASWTGLSERFWHNAQLQAALTRFRELGGKVNGTRFINHWQIQLPQREPYEINAPSGWITLPHHVERTITATSSVPWDQSGDAPVELLLYAADGAELAIVVNGQECWRRGGAPEGKRVCIPVVLHAGDNRVEVCATRRTGRGLGFSLGIRLPVHMG